jgi:GTPase
MIDVKICIGGSVDAGKSTTIGVLTKNVIDDGRGYARSLILKGKHELESGRTSQISFNYINYNNEKSLTLIDLAGHEKYLKTTIHGLCNSNLDLTCIIVGANMGINKMTREHLGLTISLNISSAESILGNINNNIGICRVLVKPFPNNLLYQS